jgi:hypothetical protein
MVEQETIDASWQGAIAEAKRRIAEHEASIVLLRRAIKAFEVMHKSNEPWPALKARVSPSKGVQHGSTT